jgi:hypothetical protein
MTIASKFESSITLSRSSLDLWPMRAGRYDRGHTLEASLWYRCPRGELYTVLFRSTGLGKAELVGEIVGVKPQGDYLVMEIHTTEPVRWKIRGAVSFKDLRILIKALFRVSVLFYFLKIAAWFREPEPPGEF